MALTVAAGYVRLAGLPSVEGGMGRDSTRLALAARGILEHGLPLLPGGLVYTRGLLPAYLEAAAFALVGPSDQAARLPSLLEGALLVPAIYALARGLGGPGVALAAAAIVAFSPPLVVKSREAWLYPSFLLWFVLALAWLQRARRWGRLTDRALAGTAVAAALLSHELAVLLVPIAAISDLLSLTRRRTTFVQLAAFWPIVLAAVALVAGLSLGLRAPTAGGPTVEVREYLQPSLDSARLAGSLRMLAESQPWLLPAALLGLPLRGVAGHPATPLYLALAAILAFDGFVLVDRGTARYVVVALPLLAVAAAYGLGRLGRSLPGLWPGRRRSGRAPAVCGAALLLALTIASLDPTRLGEGVNSRAVPSTWVQALADRAPDDLIMSYGPTLTTYYLGRTDFWLRPRGYEKYVWAGSSPPRDIHSNAIVIRGQRELDRWLLKPNTGRTLWVIWFGDLSTDPSPGVHEVYAGLAALGPEERRSPDGHTILRVRL